MSSRVLEIKGVSHAYGTNPVLKNISFSVNANEYVGLVGVNGAGKSTLIKAALDFISFKLGTVEIYGRSHRLPAARKQLAFLPEKFQPPYYLKGRDFLEYMAALHEVSILQTDMEKVFQVLDLDLSALDKAVRHFSKGMAQKLGLAACFLSQRPLLILDEPMSGLDPKARAYLKKYLTALKETGTTLFFSTHLLNDVEQLCDRIIVLHEGEIKFDGTPTDCCDLYRQPTLEAAYMACIGADMVSSV